MPVNKKKKITALSVLTQMDELDRKAKSPSNPYIYGAKYKETCANDIEKAIERFAKISGFLAERTKTQGRMLEAKYINTDYGRVQTSTAKMITSTSRKGSSDMKLLIKGTPIACEIKFKKDRQSEVQSTYQKDYEASGGVYIIVKTFEDFLVWYVKRYGRPQIMQQAIRNLIGN